jgi:hypothetical protein
MTRACLVASMSAIASIVALTACTHRVHLTAPGPHAPPVERVAAFMKLRPVQTGTLSENGRVVSKSLILADQTEVVVPEDLEPVVGTDSETMEYARASKRARDKEDIAFYVGAAVFITGAILSGFRVGESPPFGLSPWVGIGIMGASLIPLWPVRRYYAREDLRMRSKAFSTYTRDLGMQLNVCAHGMRVVACEAPLDTIDPFAPPAPKKEPATTMPERTALRMRR